MSTFGGVSALPGSPSIPRRLLLQVGRSIPDRLLSQVGSVPGTSLEGTGREVSAPVPPTSQPLPPSQDMNLLVIIAALICALLCAMSFVSMLRCALQCRRRAFRSPEAVATRRFDTGMKKAAINALPTVTYRKELQPPEAGTDCPICLAEFEEGEKLRALPQCNHCFHIQCVDRWFRSHSSCPTCRNCLLGQAKAQAATPSNNSQSGQVCESSGMQIPRAESLAQVAGQVAPPACQGNRDSESFKDDKSGMDCWNSGKASCDISCGIGR